MSDVNQPLNIDMGGVIRNAFGEHSLFGVNRNLFQGTDASTVFRNYYGETLFSEDTFYIIAGSDSGLLYQYIKAQGVPQGSRYLFVELSQVLTILHDIDDPEPGLSVTDEENWQERANDMDLMDYAIQERLVLRRSLGVVHGHCSAYSPFWRNIQEAYTTFIDSQHIALNGQAFTVRQIENLSENQVPAICLRESFIEKTAVVLAGGPSLSEVLPWVLQHRENLLVIAVSRISHSLLEAGIQPDIIVSVDPYPIILYVSRDMLEFQDDALLVSEYHLSSNLLSSWGGKKAYVGKRYPWLTSLEPDNLPQSPGSTVTNTAVAIAMETGVAQIVLGGVDFCFSQEGYTHASGSAEHALGPRPTYGNKRVMTNSGKMADSHYAFMESANSMGQQATIAAERGCLFINPAADAMRLPNVEHLPLEIIEIEPLERPAQETITAWLPTMDANTRSHYYQENLKEVDRVLEELRHLKEHSGKALKYNKALYNEDEEAIARATVKLDRIEKQFKTKYAETNTFMNHFGIRRLIPIIRHNERHKDDRAGNNTLYFQAMVDTSTELIEILQRARRRILCRLEEEMPQPDMQNLFAQWREDHQSGRAIQWAHHHTDIVNQLPTTSQKELQGFKDSFADYVEKLGQLYLKGIEKGLNLDGLNARARESFQCKDTDSLQRLLDGLNKHREPKQAELYIPLVEGYLAELRDESEVAIDAYQAIPEGPAHIDALMRLFALHTQSNNLAASVDILRILSQISPTYIPMYADLLQATGDVETAVNIYTEYLLENPDDLDSMMKLGKIFHQHDEMAGVEWTMNYILGKDPDNETAKAMLRSLQQPQTSRE